MGVLSLCHCWSDVRRNVHIYFRLSNDPWSQSRMRNTHLKIDCRSTLLRNHHCWIVQILSSHHHSHGHTISARNCSRSSGRENLSYYDMTSWLHILTPDITPLGNRFLRWNNSSSYDDLWDDSPSNIFCDILYLTLLETSKMVDYKWILCFYHYLFSLSISYWIHTTVQYLVALTLDLSSDSCSDGSIWMMDDKEG